MSLMKVLVVATLALATVGAQNCPVLIFPNPVPDNCQVIVAQGGDGCRAVLLVCDQNRGDECRRSNEIFYRCSNECEQSCRNPLPNCNTRCGPPKCQCRPNFLRDGSGNCVPPNQCGLNVFLTTIAASADGVSIGSVSFEILRDRRQITHFAVPTVIALAVGTATIADAFAGISIGVAAPTVNALAVGPASTADAFVQEIAATATEIALAEMSAFVVFVSSVVIDSSATPTATADQDLNANAAVALREVKLAIFVTAVATATANMGGPGRCNRDFDCDRNEACNNGRCEQRRDQGNCRSDRDCFRGNCVFGRCVNGGGRPDRPDGGRPDRPDGGRPDRPDGGRPDRPDGGRPDRPDGGRPDRPDGGRRDGGRPDGSRPDGGRPDRPEGGRLDGGRPEGGRPEGGRPDGGRPDGGRPDGGRPDGGRPDRPDGERPDRGNRGGERRLAASEDDVNPDHADIRGCDGGCDERNQECRNGRCVDFGDEDTHDRVTAVPSLPRNARPRQDSVVLIGGRKGQPQRHCAPACGNRQLCIDGLCHEL
uniref:TIL domain-containing protein n=1 Tax=Plectus sambesii TaxID=2011161 RepID=A0A914UNY9_9BILA